MNRLHRITAILTVPLSALLGAGCETTDDPSKGGFFGGMHGLSSGAYERRTQEREARLQQLRDAQADLEAEHAALEDDVDQGRARIARQERKLERLRGEVDALVDNVERIRIGSSTERARMEERRRRLAQLESDLQRLERERGMPGSDLAELERRRGALHEEYTQLLELYLTLQQ